MSDIGSESRRAEGLDEFQRLNSDLPESPETYWRWGLPSLVLGTLTVALALASQFYVQPRVVSRYEGAVRKFMELEPGETLVTGVSRMVVDLQAKHNGATDTGAREDDAAILSRIARFKQAELAAQRLVVEQPTNSEHRYASALIALGISECYWMLERSNQLKDDHTLRMTYEQSAIEARDRAEDAMRSARRYPGVGSLLAEKWGIREELNRTRLFSKDTVANLKTVLERIEMLRRENPDDYDWDRLLGRSMMMLGLCPVWDGSDEQRLALVEQAEALFKRCIESDSRVAEDDGGSGFSTRVWLAEAIAVRSEKESVDWAKQSLIHRHSKGVANRVGGLGEGNAEGIDAMFRAMLFMGSTEEASAAFESRRDHVSFPERSAAQLLLASSCVRLAVLRALASREGDAGLNDGKFVRLVMRLAPQASDARALIDAWVSELPMAGDLFATQKEPADGEDRALEKVVQWLRREKKGSSGDDAIVSAKIFPDDWMPQQSDAEVLVGVVPTLLEWVGKKEISSRRAAALLDEMRSSAPRNLDLVYASAILALQTRQFDRAIADLRRLLDELPGNPQLERLLVTAYENATRAKTMPDHGSRASESDRSPAGSD